MLDKHLIPCSDTGESKVFYYKMKGDYHRYLAEFATANERKEAAENSLVAYKAASDIALTELATTHPIRCDIICRSCLTRTQGRDYEMRQKYDTQENMSFWPQRFMSLSPVPPFLSFSCECRRPKVCHGIIYY